MIRQLALAVTLFWLPFGSLSADVSGLWVGYYAYQAEQGGGRVEAAMVLQQIGAQVGGTMIERQTFGDQVFPGLPSDLIGALEDGVMLLDKVYLHEYQQEGGAAQSRKYQLVLSEDGTELKGAWMVNDLRGTLYFRRVTAESAARIPAPR